MQQSNWRVVLVAVASKCHARMMTHARTHGRTHARAMTHTRMRARTKRTGKQVPSTMTALLLIRKNINDLLIRNIINEQRVLRTRRSCLNGRACTKEKKVCRVRCFFFTVHTRGGFFELSSSSSLDTRVQIEVVTTQRFRTGVSDVNTHPQLPHNFIIT